ncbi:hypothetical protein [Deinococcus cellulosilyticus]|uniref:Uncharacterized protein n=1 Tax=Deinococcus cellulosilyticus (strain DSM 18568 / NBRC 106333 / KACC 11606 / 5516J-15) TaxID=1223518 RepID=A0A511MW02_DEIC1|nr:hypothetical protein [Deinococcus cellulosilyticus]GEM44753.1 hypothetical protein DC3_03880 [Deinococcus cellulosilyticus NBRC 106333 = KACC 11606]
MTLLTTLPVLSSRPSLQNALVGAGCLLACSGVAQAENETITLQNQQATQVMFRLQEAFKSMKLGVQLVGWSNETGTHAGAPVGFNVRFPRALPASQNPILPLSVQITGDTDLTSLTLLFEVTTPQGPVQVPVPLKLPARAKLELQAPEAITTLPGHTVQLSLKVRNMGPIPARVHLEFSLALQGIPDFDLQPGAERTLNVPVPTQPSDQVLEVGLITSSSTQHKKILLRGVRAVDSPYRVRLQWGSNFESGQPFRTQFRAEGDLSSTVRFSASMQLQDLKVQDPGLMVGVGKTTVNYGSSPASGVAGSAGEGLYVSTEPVKDLQVGAGWGMRTGMVRLGAKYATRSDLLYWSVAAHTDLAFTRPEVAVSLQHPEWSWNARSTPGQSMFWSTGASYTAQGKSLNARVSYGQSGWGGSLRGSLKLLPGEDTFSSEITVANSQWQDLQFRYSNRDTELGWTYRPEHRSELTGSHRLVLEDLNIKFSTSASLKAFEIQGAEVSADATYTQGPLQLNAFTSLKTGGRGAFNLSGKYTSLLDSGELALEGGVRSSWESGNISLFPFASVNYRDVNGLQGYVSVNQTRAGTHYRAGLSYRYELPVPASITAALDGTPPADPSTRTVRFDVQGTGFQPSLSGVRVSGCGMSGQSDANGRVVLKGYQGPCTLAVDRSSLPAHTHLKTQTLPSEPGDSLTVQLVPTFDFRGRIEYEKTSDSALIPPTPRKVRVMIAGVETFWKDVDMPAGTFEVKDLPVGEYTLSVEDGKPVTRVLLPDGPPVVLTLPAPQVQTLKKTTPPMKLNWKSLTVGAGTSAELNVTSEAAIQQLIVRGPQVDVLQDCKSQPSCTTAFVVPVSADGLLSVQVEVHFKEGGVARRTAQLIVTPVTQGETR